MFNKEIFMQAMIAYEQSNSKNQQAVWKLLGYIKTEFRNIIKSDLKIIDSFYPFIDNDEQKLLLKEIVCSQFDFENSKIKNARINSNLTQIDLAEKIGVTQKDVSRWETGERNPKIDKLMLVADACNCDIKDLI